MPVEWIEHRGKKILIIDLRDLGTPAMLDDLHRADQLFLEIPIGTRVLHLIDFRGATVHPAVMNHLKQSGKAIVEPRTEKAAIIGIDGIRHILLAAYNRFTGAGKRQKLFDNQEEALEWLVS